MWKFRTTGTTISQQIKHYFYTTMSLTKNSDGSYTFKPDNQGTGYEAVALGGCLPIDLTGDGTSLGLMGGLEYSTGGVLSLGLYSALHKYLTLEVARKAGLCDRAFQLKETRDAAWESCRDKSVYVIIIGLLAAIFPGLGGILAIAGLVGGGFMTYRLGSAFFNSLDNEQVLELRKQATAAGINLPGLDDAAEKAEAASTAVGYDTDEPLPQGA